MRVAEGEVTHLVVKYKGQKMMITLVHKSQILHHLYSFLID